jgi:hypothetical protein
VRSSHWTGIVRQSKFFIFLSAESDRAMKQQWKEVKKKEENIEQGKEIKEPNRKRK